MSDPNESRARKKPWSRGARVAVFALFFIPMSGAAAFVVSSWIVELVKVVRECTCTCRGPDAAR